MVSETSNRDIIHVQEELKQILTYFKDCSDISPDVPVVVKEQLRDIGEQGKEFHTCLQKSITQSSNLEINAESAISCLITLDDPNSDPNLISDALIILSNNARQNKEETCQIEAKYESIRNKLAEINDKYYESEMNDKKKLRSLKEEREDLEENLKSHTMWNSLFFIAAIIQIGILLLQVNVEENIRVFLGFGLTITIISVTTGVYSKKKVATNLRKTKREIGYLEQMEELVNTSKQEIRELSIIYKKIDSIIIQMGYFNTYWGVQHHLLEELNNNANLDGISNQSRKVLMAPMKPRWEELKALCDKFTRTVRKTVTDVRNS